MAPLAAVQGQDAGKAWSAAGGGGRRRGARRAELSEVRMGAVPADRRTRPPYKRLEAAGAGPARLGKAAQTGTSRYLGRTLMFRYTGWWLLSN